MCQYNVKYQTPGGGGSLLTRSGGKHLLRNTQESNSMERKTRTDSLSMKTKMNFVDRNDDTGVIISAAYSDKRCLKTLKDLKGLNRIYTSLL